MVDRYRCLICSELLDSLEDLEYHLEHSDDYHTEMLEKLGGMSHCYQVVSVEELDGGTEFTDPEYRGKNITKKDAATDFAPSAAKYFEYPKHSEAELEGYYKYPYPPYYYSPKEQAFICTEHRFGTKDFSKFMTHMLKEHGEDFENWLRFHVKEQIKYRIRHEKGSTQHLSDETLNRLVDSELKELMITSELTHKTNIEAFSGFVSNTFSELKDFLTAKTTICPLCHHDMEGYTEPNEYEAQKILSLLKGQMNLSKEPKDYKEKYPYYVKRKYPAKWEAEDIDLCLRNTLHMHLSHNRIESLVKAKILSGALPEWLASKGYADKKPLNLSTVFPDNQPSPSDKNLSKDQKNYLKWLRDGR